MLHAAGAEEKASCVVYSSYFNGENKVLNIFDETTKFHLIECFQTKSLKYL